MICELECSGQMESMKSLRKLVSVSTVIVLVAAFSSPVGAAGPTFQMLYGFAGKQNGYSPQTGLVTDAAGNLYGTTPYGGGSPVCAPGCGTLFELSPQPGGQSWAEKVLHRFNGLSDGAFPLGRLIFDSHGNLYGTAASGGDLSSNYCKNGLNVVVGCGVVFELSPPTVPGGSWTETVLHNFVGIDGAFSDAGVIFDELGNLYGTTSLGGSVCSSTGCGVVFELSPPGQAGGQWTDTTLYEFTGGSDGYYSLSDLTFDPSGALYGTTCDGGDLGGGVVFKLSPPLQQGFNWTDATLFSFPFPNCPSAGVVFDSAFNLFGTTSSGQQVFELSPQPDGTWTESLVYRFTKSQQDQPSGGLVVDGLGNLYGARLNRSCGALYRLQNHQGVWVEAEYDFTDRSTQPCRPYGTLIFGKQNALYGVSSGGGSPACISHNCGTVFAIRP